MSRLLYLALLLLFSAPAVAAQDDTPQDSTAYCDSLCRLPLLERIVPRNPPFLCDCMVLTGTGGSGGGNDEPMTPEEILDRMWEDHERRVANVNNYTLVQTTSSAPMPVVLYYEKEVIDGLSTFQLISPAELADREAAASGQPTSQEIGTGVVALADMLGGLVGGGGADSAPPPDEQSAQGGSQNSASGDDDGGGNGGSGGGLLDQIVEGIRDFGEGLQEGRQNFEKQQGIVDELFWNEELVSRMENTGKQDVLVDGEIISCDVLYVDDREGEIMDLGPGYEGYRIWYARLWVSDEDTGFFEPIAMDLVLMTPSGDHVHLERTHKDFRQDGPDGPIVPRRTRMTMDGIGGLIQGAVNDVWTELQTVLEVLVNDGAPTQEQSAMLIADAMERLGL